MSSEAPPKVSLLFSSAKAINVQEHLSKNIMEMSSGVITNQTSRASVDQVISQKSDGDGAIEGVTMDAKVTATIQGISDVMSTMAGQQALAQKLSQEAAAQMEGFTMPGDNVEANNRVISKMKNLVSISNQIGSSCGTNVKVKQQIENIVGGDGRISNIEMKATVKSLAGCIASTTAMSEAGQAIENTTEQKASSVLKGLTIDPTMLAVIIIVGIIASAAVTIFSLKYVVRDTITTTGRIFGQILPYLVAAGMGGLGGWLILDGVQTETERPNPTRVKYFSAGIPAAKQCTVSQEGPSTEYKTVAEARRAFEANPEYVAMDFMSYDVEELPARTVTSDGEEVELEGSEGWEWKGLKSSPETTFYTKVDCTSDDGIPTQGVRMMGYADADGKLEPGTEPAFTEGEDDPLTQPNVTISRVDKAEGGGDAAAKWLQIGGGGLLVVVALVTAIVTATKGKKEAVAASSV